MAIPSNLSQLSELAATISKNAAILDKHLTSRSLPLPSFDEDAPKVIPIADPSVLAAKLQLTSAARDLYALTTGPFEWLKVGGMTESYLSAVLNILCESRVPQSIPAGGAISYEELAGRTAMDVGLLKRFLRFAMTNRYFHEDSGLVGHTAGSKLLATDEGLRVGALKTIHYPTSP
jgi:hypothetical protein